MAINEAEYLKAFVTAGKHLQACMDANAAGGFRWLKAKPSKPAFADLVFASGQRVYAVILVGMSSQKKLNDDQTSCTFEIPKEQRLLLLAECERYNLEPLAFPLWLGIMQPLMTGWNLFSLKENLRLITPGEPQNDSEPLAAMSEWELSNFRISLVMKDIEELKLPIHSYQDIPEIFPNIWFDNEEGRRSWVAVIPAEHAHDNSLPEQVKDIHRKLAPEFDGYLARVGVRNATQPEEPPVRGGDLHVYYRGLEKLP